MDAPVSTEAPETEREWYSVQRLAKVLDVKEDTIRSWVRRGSGPKHYKLGSLTRFRVEDVDEWLSRNER